MANKILMGFLMGLVIGVFGLLFSSLCWPKTQTGHKMGPFDIGTSQTITVQANGSYEVTATSCSPFSIATDGKTMPGEPQDTNGYCSAFYKLDSTFTGKTITVASGEPNISFTSDNPIGVTIAYYPSVVDTVNAVIIIIAFALWLLCVIYA